MKERYVKPIKFRANALKLIAICDDIVTDYSKQDFKLTVRQIYYQLVARGHIENTIQSYNNIQNLLNDARLCGYIDWDAIEDRTRGILEQSHWKSGGQLLQACAGQYFEDMWEKQPYRPFVIVEKEALAGVLEPICQEYDVPLLPARGYPSASTLRELAKERIMPASQQIIVLHLGDHDPSGIDMSRDLEERLSMFSRFQVHIDFRRIALNMDQVEEQNPPPNPAKTTDSRYENYRQQFGEESWELDALSPQYIHQIVGDELNNLIDTELWDEKEKRITDTRTRLQEIADIFDEEDEK